MLLNQIEITYIFLNNLFKAFMKIKTNFQKKMACNSILIDINIKLFGHANDKKNYLIQKIFSYSF